MKVYKDWGWFIDNHISIDKTWQTHYDQFMSKDNKLLYSLQETDIKRCYKTITILFYFFDHNINFSDNEVIKVGNLEYSLSIDSDRCVKFELL